MTKFARIALASIAVFTGASATRPQAKPLASAQDVQKIYCKLPPQIDRIAIYDNHSHATFPDDSDMDAQAAPPDESSVLRLRDTNPEFIAAAKSLFGYPYDDFQPEHAKWLAEKSKAPEKHASPPSCNTILDK